MGDDSKETVTEGSSSETRTLDQREREQETLLNQLDLALRAGAQEGLAATQEAGLASSAAILRGEALPGNLEGAGLGVTPEIEQSIVDRALADVDPEFQLLGLSDSGPRTALRGELSATIRNSNARFNSQQKLARFEAGTRGSAAAQQSQFLFSESLGRRLAGLRGSTEQTDRSSFEKEVVTDKERFGLEDAIRLAIIAASIPGTGGASLALLSPEVAAAALGANS